METTLKVCGRLVMVPEWDSRWANGRQTGEALLDIVLMALSYEMKDG
jgi:hypothetical protein